MRKHTPETGVRRRGLDCCSALLTSGILTCACWVSGEATAESKTSVSGLIHHEATSVVRVGRTEFQYLDELVIPMGDSTRFEVSEATTSLFVLVSGPAEGRVEGTLVVRDGVEVFLNIPSGVRFGEEAVIDVGGDFGVGTASGLVFATSDETGSTINMIEPPRSDVDGDLRLEELEFAAAGRIVVRTRDRQRFGFASAEGHDLALLGGDILIDGADVRSQGGALRMVALRDGRVAVDAGETQRTAGFLISSSGDEGDILISNLSFVDSTAPNPADQPGVVALRGALLAVDNSEVTAFSREGAGREVSVAMSEDIFLRNAVLLGGTLGPAQASLLTIGGRNMDVVGSLVGTTAVVGRANSVRVQLEGRLLLDGQDGGDFSGVVDASSLFRGPDANASGGRVRIAAQVVEAVRGGKIASRAYPGGGRGGGIQIVTTLLNIDGSRTAEGCTSGIFADDRAGPAVNGAGGIRISSRITHLRGCILANGLRGALGGDVTIFSQTFRMSEGAELRVGGTGAGRIFLSASRFSMAERSRIEADAAGGPNTRRGTIEIESGGLNGSGDSDMTANADSGVGGLIQIVGSFQGFEVRDSLSSGSDITAFGPDGPGEIRINGRELR